MHRLELTTFLAYSVLLYSSTHGLEFLEAADSFEAVVGTRARLNFVHDYDGPVEVWWVYLGTESRPTRNMLAIQSGSSCHRPPSMLSKLECGTDSKNVTLFIHDVTDEDVGWYEVRVLTQDESIGYIDTITSLKVWPCESLSYKITVNDSTHALTACPAGAGTSRSPVMVPIRSRLNVTVDVNRDAPVPLVQIVKKLDQTSHEDQPPCHDHSCNRYVGFCSDDLPSGGQTSGHVSIMVDFPTIQNVNKEPFKHNVTVHRPSADDVQKTMRSMDFRMSDTPDSLPDQDGRDPENDESSEPPREPPLKTKMMNPKWREALRSFENDSIKKGRTPHYRSATP